MKILAVGDLHGNIEIVEKMSRICGYDKVLFIGDYVDSFTRDIDDQLGCLLQVLHLARTAPEKYVVLLGNHELSYIELSMRCSGWSQEKQNLINSLVPEMKEHLVPFFRYNDWLFSHAGVSQNLLNEEEITLDEYLESGNFNQIGRIRGGLDSVGGLHWCHWRGEFEPIPGINQVVGHTHYKPKKYFFDTIDGHDSANINIDVLPQFKDDKLEDSRFLEIDIGYGGRYTLKQIKWEDLG